MTADMIDEEVLTYIRNHAYEAEENEWNIIYNYMIHVSENPDDEMNWDSMMLYDTLVGCIPNVYKDILREFEKVETIYDYKISAIKFAQIFSNSDVDTPENIGDFFDLMHDLREHYFEEYEQYCSEQYQDARYAWMCMENPISIDAMLILYFAGGLSEYYPTEYNWTGNLKNDLSKLRKELIEVNSKYMLY